MDSSFDRVSDGKDEWLTPPSILKPLGKFDLDPCFPVSYPWPELKPETTYTIHDDGLNREWKGRVWCNPPYGNQTGKWLKKLAEHGDGIAFVFARTETKMFHEHVFGKASGIFFLKGRVKFYNSDGTAPKNTAGAPSCLIAYGEENAKLLRELNITGALKGHFSI